MRRIAWIVPILVLSGCTEREQPRSTVTIQPAPVDTDEMMTPEETVRKLLNAYFGKRLGEYYSLVASVDKEVKSLESLQNEFAPSSSDLVTDYIFKFTRFRVDSSLVEGDTAFVYVTSTGPDPNRVFREAAVVEQSLGEKTDLTTKISLLNERLRLAGGARVENQGTYFLVRESKGWRAVVGWAERKAFEERMQADSAQGDT